jgi:exodeoxyribonuclease V beta subunit
VALTRARHRCCVVWGGFKDAESSAPAWLLHQPPDAEAPVPTAVIEHFARLDDAQLRADLERLAAASTDESGRRAIEVIDVPRDGAAPRLASAPDVESLRPRTFAGRIRQDWRISSFSSLAASRSPEEPDRDSIEEPPRAPQEPVPDIFAFPAGVKAGTCLHEIFESLDFANAGPETLRTLVAAKLREHGYASEEWTEIVSDMVQRTLAVPLDPERRDFTLSRIPLSARLSELEFYFPVSHFSPGLLREVAGHHAGAENLPADWPRRLEFPVTDGCVKGYIDLVFQFENRFYVVDWKSNRLGIRIEDYGPERLAREMAGELYPLQYLLYTVALHRHLRLRVPGYDYERHFGGVRYLFLRGIDPARPQFGVFRARPAAGAIEELSRRLAGPESGQA